MTALDWGVVGLYALVLLGIGVVSTRKQASTDEYFRGSRKLPWWAVGISLIATAFSAASLLGGPGEGFSHGLLWLQLQLGDLLGYGLVCLLLIPVYVRLDATSAYEYLEHRFDAKTRCLGAACFVLFVVVRLGALLFGAALVFSEVAGVSVDAAILAVGVVAVGYTMAGGMAAVIWTDVLQFVVILVGVGAAIAVAASGVEGGLGGALSAASAAGRLSLVDLSWDPASLRTLPTAVIGYGILAFAVAGTNQQSVQRYLCCESVSDARKAAMLGWFTGFVGVAATLVLGVLLSAFYAQRPGTLPDPVKPDQVFPIFIGAELPVGVAGLLVAAVFAAAMSSVDSALHSLSTCLVVDVYRRFLNREASDAQALKVARGLIVVWGLVGIVAAFYVARTGESLLPFLVKYSSYTVGPLLGLFLLGVAVPWATGHGAFFGALVAVSSLAAFFAFGPWHIPGIWFAAIAAPLTVLLGGLISMLVPAGGASEAKSISG